MDTKEIMELARLLKKQVTIASWQLGLFIIIIAGYITLIAAGYREVENHNGYDYSYSREMVGAGIFALVLIVPAGIASFVLWILGIINAAKINGITGSSGALVVFAVITLIFGHLIAAVSAKNKYLPMTQAYEAASPQAPSQKATSSQEAKLKQAFVDGVISAAEYEKKMAELKKEKPTK